MARLLAATAVAAALTLASGAAAAPAGRQGDGIRHGVVVGEVTSESAVLWARGAQAGSLRVSLSGGPHEGIDPVQVSADDDWAGQLRLDGLAPSTEYGYPVQFTPGWNNSNTGWPSCLAPAISL